ncbi:MAG: tetratricopeptide repeat protein [Acidobacteriota bacterium]
MDKLEEKTAFVSLQTGIGDMPFGKDEYLTERDAGRKREALNFFQRAYEAQMDGNLDEAADWYKQSIEIYPTAEAHTFLGWTYSFMGMPDEAIEECHQAIAVDPDFGNPYNDIGAYLIDQGDLRNAIDWLEKAKQARRYEPVFYPYFNLGRVYQTQGKLFEALNEYKTAIDLNPNYKLAIKAFRTVQSKLN